MSYNIDDLKNAFKRNDKATIIEVIQSVYNTLDNKDKELEANKKEIAELKQSMLLCSGPCHFPDSEEKPIVR